MSNGILLTQHNEVVYIDFFAAKVGIVHRKESSIGDIEIEDFLEKSAAELPYHAG